MTEGGDLYILDMGVPVKIADLAHRLIRLRGLRPGVDIPIQVTGPRPGEKLFEELVAIGEEKMRTLHPAIFRICQTAPLDLSRLDSELDALLEYSANGATPEGMRAGLKKALDSVETVQA